MIQSITINLVHLNVSKGSPGSTLVKTGSQLTRFDVFAKKYRQLKLCWNAGSIVVYRRTTDPEMNRETIKDRRVYFRLWPT